MINNAQNSKKKKLKGISIIERNTINSNWKKFCTGSEIIDDLSFIFF